MFQLMDDVMPFSLDGRVALVTGSSTGLGKAIAFSLARCGARVALNYYNNEERAAETFSEFEAEGFEGLMLRADVSEEESVNALCKEVAEKLGGIDILVVNATPDQPQMPIEEFTWEHFQTMIDFFIKSPYLLTRAVLPHMKENRWGRIINITSEVFQRSIGNFSAYVAAKAGIVAFTKKVAREAGPYGVTCKAVAPGTTLSERGGPTWEQRPEEEKQRILEEIPLRRVSEPEDQAKVIAFLASGDADYVTGVTIDTSGGRH